MRFFLTRTNKPLPKSDAGRIILPAGGRGAVPMIKTDSGWQADIILRPGKHLYKFIIDDNWRIDKDNSLVENDGMGNDNSVYFKPNYNFTLNGYADANGFFLAGSFNNWQERICPCSGLKQAGCFLCTFWRHHTLPFHCRWKMAVRSC